MRRVSIASALVLGLAALAAPGPAAGSVVGESPVLEVEVAPQTVRVGDIVSATLTLELPVELDRDLRAEPDFPNWQRHWGDAELRSVDEVARTVDGDRARYVQRVTLTSFRPGPVALATPLVTLEVGSEDETLEVLASGLSSFEVVSVLPPAGEEELEPKPPEAPRRLPAGAAFWWTAALMTALSLVLVLLLLRRRTTEAAQAVVVDPWEALERALAKLARTDDAEAVFTGLSLELRRYLGHCLAFPAAESTTTELRRRLRRSGLPAGVAAEVVRLLAEADTIKFAKKRPAADRVVECLEEARSAAAEVRTFLQPEEPETEVGEERAA